MPSATPRRAVTRLVLLLLVASAFAVAQPARAQDLDRIIAKSAPACAEWSLEADQQRAVGKVFDADGNVDVKCGDARLRADHVQYDSEQQTISATGHVQLDYLTQHVDADAASYELQTGRGNFQHARGRFAIQRRPMPTLLLSPNPIYFDAEEAERIDQFTYRVRNAWLTVCDPARPTWKFYAPLVTVRLQESIHLENGNFRLFSVPVLYFPYATLPAEKRRNSGFLIPEVANSTRKGFVLGEAFYWAPLDWLDMTLGASYYSKRGWSQDGTLRLRPWETASLEASYYGVLDRGLPQPGGVRVNQGGQEAHLLFTSMLPGDWRAVADLDHLSSLTFRLAFAETFTQAVNSEVQNTAFLTKSHKGYTMDFSAL